MPKPEVGGLVRAFDQWLALDASDWILGVIRGGFRLLWEEERAPLTSLPPAWKPLSVPSAQEALELEVAELIRKRAVELVVKPSSPGFYGRLFVVPKANGGWRPVLDLSPLNVFLRRIKFRMETPASVRSSIRQGDWATSIDLTDAYFHVLMHARDRKYLRFVWGARIFQFRALPFGLSLAPWIFTMVARELCGAVRGLGIFLRAYLDDWLIHNQSKLLCLEHTETVLKTAARLGFSVNFSKSDLTPSQQFVYLGMAFDTVAYLVRPAPARVSKLLDLLIKLRQKSTLTPREIAALLGSMESLAPLVPLGRAYKRPLQREFKSRWVQGSQQWDSPIASGLWFQQAVEPWMNRAWLEEGVPIQDPPADWELFTDASLLGWGAHMGSLTAHGVWTESQQLLHINMLELEAVALAMSSFLSSLRGCRVTIVTDNTTVAAYLNHQGGTVSRALSIRSEELLFWARSHEIAVSARHIAGSLNVIADQLSRPNAIVQTEWTLCHRVLHLVWEAWGKPMVDLFATRFNNRLPIYASPVPDPKAWAIDALACSWSGLDAYAFPPLALLKKVLAKAEKDAPRLILIAPKWPAQQWYPDLLSLSHLPPLKLPVGDRGLLQPRSGIPHLRPQWLDLHAWLLCGDACTH